MKNCIPCVHIKHATLIDNCYPQTGSTPRSSELSYLTFYASSRPAKLTKVGLYLLKKVTRDIRKGRKENNLVSLHILKSLIQTCHRDLNIFSKYVIKILTMLLDTRDLDLIDLTCETFIVFCSYHDGNTLGVDTEFTTDYEELVDKFSSFCNYTNQDETFSLKMRYIGHRATQAAVTSSSLHASNFKRQLSIILPPLMVTLASSDTTTLPTSDGSIDIRDSALDGRTIDDRTIQLLAAHTISILFNKVTGPAVRLSLVPLFDYMDKSKRWWPPTLAINIMKLVLESLQPPYRYLLVSDVLRQLDSKEEGSMLDDKHASLVAILDSILNANLPLVGLSVLEVLNALFNLLIQTTHHYPFLQPTTTDEEKTTSSFGLSIQKRLIHSIGGLATQIYYENQLSDMMGYLISKLRPNTSLDNVDSMSMYDYRRIVLHCIDSIVDKSRKVTSVQSEADIKMVETLFPLDSWNPALSLLCDKNPKSRMAFSKTLYNFLHTMAPRITLDPTDEHPQHASTSYVDASFIDCLVHTIQDWTRVSDFNLTDLRFIYAYLCILTRKFGIDATVMIVPLIFRIQQLIKENKITLTSRQYAMESALISLFDVMASFYHIQSLADYISDLKKDRINHVLLTETLDTTNMVEPELFTISVHDAEEKINHTWIDRSTVVEIMSKDGRLCDEKDTHGLELEAKLFAEWGSEAFLKKDHTMRARIIQDADEIKPRLASPWTEHADFIRSNNTYKHNGVRVATLKDALVSHGEDDVDSVSTQTNSQSTQSKPTNLNMNALLNELNLPLAAPNTVSLVNPPYTSA